MIGFKLGSFGVVNQHSPLNFQHILISWFVISWSFRLCYLFREWKETFSKQVSVRCRRQLLGRRKLQRSILLFSLSRGLVRLPPADQSSPEPLPATCTLLPIPYPSVEASKTEQDEQASLELVRRQRRVLPLHLLDTVINVVVGVLFIKLVLLFVVRWVRQSDVRSGHHDNNRDQYYKTFCSFNWQLC